MNPAVWLALISAIAPIFMGLAAFISSLTAFVMAWRIRPKVDEAVSKLTEVTAETGRHRAVEEVQGAHVVGILEKTADRTEKIAEVTVATRELIQALPEATGKVAALSVVSAQRQIPRRDDPQ